MERKPILVMHGRPDPKRRYFDLAQLDYPLLRDVQACGQGSVPTALLKGFVEQTAGPGCAFSVEGNSGDAYGKQGWSGRAGRARPVNGPCCTIAARRPRLRWQPAGRLAR